MLFPKKTERVLRITKGTRRKELFEHAEKGEKMHGFTENYVKIVTDYAPAFINNIIEVAVGEYDDNELAMRIEKCHSEVDC